MRFKNILVPYDSSKHAQRALAIAQDFALANPEAIIHMLAAVDVDPDMATFNPDPLLGDAFQSPVNIEEFQDLTMAELSKTEHAMATDVRAILTQISEDRVTVKATLNPSPADAIKDYCDKYHCDLVVMGRRGLGGLRGLVGSVASAVLKKVDVPVLTVK